MQRQNGRKREILRRRRIKGKVRESKEWFDFEGKSHRDRVTYSIITV